MVHFGTGFSINFTVILCLCIDRLLWLGWYDLPKKAQQTSRTSLMIWLVRF